MVVSALGHIAMYFNIIPSKIILCVTDATLLVSFFTRSYQNQFVRKNEEKLYKLLPQRRRCFYDQNKFLKHWKSLNMDSGKRLPLDRVALLKAKYNIGPFISFEYASEIPISFFKKQAEIIDDAKCNHSISNMECHPDGHITKFTEIYVQHRAIMYSEQQIANLSLLSQTTIPEDPKQSRESRFSLSEFPTYSFLMSSDDMSLSHNQTEINPTYAIATIPDNNSAILHGVTKETNARWHEFQEEMKGTKEKLKEVQDTFSFIREDSRLNQQSKIAYDDLTKLSTKGLKPKEESMIQRCISSIKGRLKR